MGGGDNPYAPPAADIEVERVERTKRVGGWLRLLAFLIDVTPMIAVNQLLHDQRLNAFTQFATIAVSVATEVCFAASPGMLLLGLRVRLADGRTAPLRRLVAKAFAVRLVNLIYLPGTIGAALGIQHVRAAHRDSALPQTGWQWAVMICGLLYIAGFLGAFAGRRQTVYDRLLGLAVFRR